MVLGVVSVIRVEWSRGLAVLLVIVVTVSIGFLLIQSDSNEVQFCPKCAEQENPGGFRYELSESIVCFGCGMNWSPPRRDVLPELKKWATGVLP